MVWSQVYDPLHNHAAVDAGRGHPDRRHARRRLPSSTSRRTGRRSSGSSAALIVAIFVFGMPAEMAGMAALYGAPVRAAADRLDRPQHHLPVPADRAKAARSRCCRRASPASRRIAACSCC